MAGPFRYSSGRADLNDAIPLAVRVHLLISRGHRKQARALLAMLDGRYPGHPDLVDLRAELMAADLAAGQEKQRSRDLRFSLGLNTSWRRFLWACGCAGLAIYSVYAVLPAVAAASKGGLSMSLTTMVSAGSRYSRHMEPWTRPAWIDFVYCGALLAAAAVGVVVLIRATRGAADWEEMDVRFDNDGWRRGGWSSPWWWWW
jgi:hypothetical protein